MIDPPRLRDLEGASEEARLLRSATGDAPHPRARGRLLASMGLAAVTTATTATTTATASGLAATQVAHGASQVGKLGAPFLFKLAGAALLVGGLGLMTSRLVRTTRTASTVTTTISTTSTTPNAKTTDVTAASNETAKPDPTANPRATESATAAPMAMASEAPSRPPAIDAPKPTLAPQLAVETAASGASVASVDLAAELAQVEAARAALGGGNPAAALDALDARDRAFPNGSLGVEASALRVEALVRLGRNDEARRLGEAFLVAHPNGGSARRVRAALASIP